MPLPSTRNTTYAANDPVKSADLNAIQDSVISAKHGDIEMVFQGTTGIPVTVLPNFDGIWAFAGGGSDFVLVPIILPVGSRIKRLTHRYNRAGAGSMLMRFQSVSAIGGPVPIDDVTDAATTGWQSLSGAVIAAVVATGLMYMVQVNGTAAANRYNHTIVLLDKP